MRPSLVPFDTWVKKAAKLCHSSGPARRYADIQIGKGRILSVKVSIHRNARAPEGFRIYAIGDIHGRVDLLSGLLDLIERDRESRPAMPTLLLFLGDYVDRGPDSKGAVDFLINGLPAGLAPIFLKGNHEDLLLTFLQDPISGLGWLHNGGGATMESYGVPKSVIREAMWLRQEAVLEAGSMFAAAMPPDHLRFYEQLSLFYRAGGYFFVHGGVRPGVPLERQREDDLLWIREEFLRWPDDFGAVVVHGHTPVQWPDDFANRIGIDTYAYQTGKLTAVGLEGPRRWFIST